MERCKEIGVEVVASMPGLGVQPGPDEPHEMRAFLFQHLRVANLGGK